MTGLVHRDHATFVKELIGYRGLPAADLEAVSKPDCEDPGCTNVVLPLR